ncbi:hypothetical protein PA598K_01444 [Paenibacillus sp. 598K]|uniref:hypothetical protein n=1 Tax=Paenibacillus sp. 598K TaxID=1117987 RepID=UPI000FF9919D|nr:hypothetical protein [Paenibacillus sp. 598K]GBF73159.1 hypothetical protein PA598K_01444 [Paenibacillus sp. 598K]
MKITREDYQRAAEHGVSENLLYTRDRRGWEREKAITTRPKQKPERSEEEMEYCAKAIQKGIKRSVYWWRVDAGWDLAKAATDAVRAWNKAY